MNRQPYQTPPRWWSPQLSPTWIGFWRHWRKRRGLRQHALREIEVRGAGILRGAIESDQGVLITPNHPSHADPFVMLEASDQLSTPFYFMTAWQVFAGTHAVGRRVLRQHGCFSVNREGHDVRAVREAVRILERRQSPLVIFPEGEVFHLNDRLTPFRPGAVKTAAWAARRSNHDVAIVPCGIKFVFVDDPTPALHRKLDQLEHAAGMESVASSNLLGRIRRLGDRVLADREREVLGVEADGPLRPRVAHLVETILAGLESEFPTPRQPLTIPDRVKRLRLQIIREWESAPDSAHRSARRRHDAKLRRLFLVTQLYSYPLDYLAGTPSLERISETVEKFEEDLLGARRVSPPATRRAVIAFDEPLTITPTSEVVAASATVELQGRVQRILDNLVPDVRPALGPAPQPTPASQPPLVVAAA